jgi:hypothetical protein
MITPAGPPNEAPKPPAPAPPTAAIPVTVPALAAAKVKRKRKAKAKTPLLFIDTNILLDFYRARNDAGISLLAKIDGIHNQTITSCQVEMEFKKNRQKVISESVSLLKPPDFSLSIPAFLSDAVTVKVIKDQILDAKKRVEKLKGRILSTLEKPKTHDRIYKTIQRLFNNPGNLNLRHDTPEYRQVWRRALRRFLEGRPPRKKEDTSAGDAVNWEWIVQCVKSTNRDVIIVSRDADYGLTLDGKGYANNWLTDEIKERVNQKRKLILVDRLSAALKLLDVKVTPEEISSERAIIKATTGAHESEIESLVGDALHGLLNGEEMSSLIARTNTFGWGCDTFDLEKAQLRDGVWTADVVFTFSGEQEDDKPWHGDTISGRCVVEIGRDKKITFSELEASLDSDEEPEEHGPDDDGPPDHDDGPPTGGSVEIKSISQQR